jgi:hypothetical protein
LGYTGKEACTWEPSENINDKEMLDRFKIDTARKILAVGNTRDVAALPTRTLRQTKVPADVFRRNRLHEVASVLASRGLASNTVEVFAGDSGGWSFDSAHGGSKASGKRASEIQPYGAGVMYLVHYKNEAHYNDEWIEASKIQATEGGTNAVSRYAYQPNTCIARTYQLNACIAYACQPNALPARIKRMHALPARPN